MLVKGRRRRVDERVRGMEWENSGRIIAARMGGFVLEVLVGGVGTTGRL